MGVYTRKVKNKQGKVVEYWCIYYVVNGNRKFEIVGKKGLVTKYHARAALNERKRDIRLNRFNIVKAKIPTLNEFIPDYTKYLQDQVLKLKSLCAA